ncbi:MAG TPA: phage tail assembly chaperone [Roseateles sp.]|uniref:phage tail assembly chaperone n=1 Tax=Roseateles sp. TaxID=1971397 RepID=UPI002ED930E9
MTRFFAELGPADCIVQVFEADEPPDDVETVEVADWAGWPQEPHPLAELRLVGGVPTWHDPRTDGQKAAAARERRDADLAACDWMVTRALETGIPMPSTWSDYRQALRDLPEQPGFPAAITWPPAPE